jgi:hypothetical protein
MPEIVEVIISGELPATEIIISGTGGPVSVVETDQLLHNSSPDLQGGTTGEYFHLTSGQYSFVTGLWEDKIDPTNDVFFEKSVTVTGTLIQGSGYSNYLTGLRVMADGNFSANGDAQVSEFILKEETTDGLSYELELGNSSKKLTLPNNTSWYFKLRVVAKDTNGATATYNAEGAIKKGISAGFTQIIGKTTIVNLIDEIGCGGVSVLANTSYGYLQVNVVGKPNTTVRWVGYLNLIEVR